VGGVEDSTRFVIVHLRQPKREITIDGAHTVNHLLDRLEMNRESFLVIRNGTLVPGDGRLEPEDTIEVRPVVSGG
jgi:sulfur carrier protein